MIAAGRGPGCKVAFDVHVLSGEGVVPMEHGHSDSPPKRGGIMGFLRGLFGGKSLSD